MLKPDVEQLTSSFCVRVFVSEERFELSRVAPLAPKASASTEFRHSDTNARSGEKTATS